MPFAFARIHFSVGLSWSSIQHNFHQRKVYAPRMSHGTTTKNRTCACAVIPKKGMSIKLHA